MNSNTLTKIFKTGLQIFFLILCLNILAGLIDPEQRQRSIDSLPSLIPDTRYIAYIGIFILLYITLKLLDKSARPNPVTEENNEMGLSQISIFAILSLSFIFSFASFIFFLGFESIILLPVIFLILFLLVIFLSSILSRHKVQKQIVFLTLFVLSFFSVGIRLSVVVGSDGSPVYPLALLFEQMPQNYSEYLVFQLRSLIFYLLVSISIIILYTERGVARGNKGLVISILITTLIILGIIFYPFIH